ncbi:hypothetical protein ACK1JC_16550 [Acinetobacter sp. TY2]|uniref:hypothetical protein n=1 Tax=Acinetobacter sp. TY2 TaxID=3387403 RepID=UPI0039177F85
MYNLYYVQIKKEFEEISQERMANIGDFINIFDTTYLIVTEMSAKDIYNKISMNGESSIFIIQCNINEYYGWANKRVWAWLDEKKKLLR